MLPTQTSSSFDVAYCETDIQSCLLWESHCHPRYELIAVLEGDVSVTLEGQSHRLTDGESILIPPLIYHTVTANRQGIYRRATSLFDLTAIPPVLRERFLQRVDKPLAFPSPQMEELRRAYAAEGEDFCRPLAESLVIRLLYTALQTALQDQENPSAGEPDEFLRQVIDYIDGHLGEKITLDHLALHTARSKSSVCHLFEEKMGISPKQYILQKKMALAGKLIRDGTPATRAAVQVGYQNYSAFYRVYHRHFGSAPSREEM